MTGYGKVKKGYEYPAVKFVVISESDIFGSEKKKKKRHRMYEGEKIASFTDSELSVTMSCMKIMDLEFTVALKKSK